MTELLRKPAWIRASFPGTPEVIRMKGILRQESLHTVCEEAACPNLGECFGHGTATFLIMGKLCTRHCPFCAVEHGRPLPLDPQEPFRIAKVVHQLKLKHVVLTSVNRDDLRDGGAGHFAACVRELRHALPTLTIEILVPDFRRREQEAIDQLRLQPPDIFNHNLETVPRLYPSVRPGAHYEGSLALLRQFKMSLPSTPTKSGLMLGLGESKEEILSVFQSLRNHACDYLTLGQYLAPTQESLPVIRYLAPEEFALLAEEAYRIGFKGVSSAPLVRSSYHAEKQFYSSFPSE